MNEHLYSTTDAAREAGVSEYRLAYAIRTQRLAPPTLKIAGRRIFTQADLERVKKYFDNLPPWKRAKEKNNE